jgi:SAM-dependent methyltransferase
MVTFGPGDAADPPFPGGSFDVVLAGNVAQFLTCPMTEVPRWGSLLTVGGTLAFSWNLAEDPHWVPVLAAFDTAMPSGVTGFAAMLRRRPFASVEQVQGLLAASAYQAITTRVHTLTLTYSSPQQWWTAAQSQGPWAACWRHIPAGRLDAAQRDAFALLDDLRGPDGSIPRTMLFACTSSQKDTP